MRLIDVKVLFQSPLTCPTDTLSPSDGKRDGVRGVCLLLLVLSGFWWCLPEAAGAIRIQPNPSVEVRPPLPVTAVTPMPRSLGLDEALKHLEEVLQVPSLSTAQASELIVATVTLMNMIKREPRLTEQDQKFIVDKVTALVSSIGSSSFLTGATKTKVAGLYLQSVGTFIVDPGLRTAEKKAVVDLFTGRVTELMQNPTSDEKALIDSVREVLRSIEEAIKTIFSPQPPKPVPCPVTQPWPMRTLAKDPSGGIRFNLAEPFQQVQEVVREDAEWKSWWEEHQSVTPRGTPAPAVDFSKEIVVLVAKETAANEFPCGFEIAAVGWTGEDLVIAINAPCPPIHNVVLPAFWVSYHIVAVPKSDLKPKFVWVPAGSCAEIKPEPQP
ncbi:MAG: hypothetical protein HY735_09940 [Verrucomicrobia bacterium]|nr:hypothetical protein [Verrucomicrobiota bacterium]